MPARPHRQRGSGLKAALGPGFGPGEPCEDSTINRCYYCSVRFDLRRELQEHKCETRPLPRSGTKAHRATKRNVMNLVGGNDTDPVRLLCASGEEDLPMGGLTQPYCVDGAILGSVISGDNDCGPDIQIRLAIGRAKYNQLYRMFTRQKMNLDLRIRLYESFVL